MNNNIPHQILSVVNTLKSSGYEAFLVGGSVRDLLLGKEPKDWDLTSNATPEQIIPLFEKTVYENSYGTVAIINEAEDPESPCRQIEVTTYRSESNYTDSRHPDDITFSKTIEEDLMRRDFTINAMAYDPVSEELIDLYKGQEHLQQKIIVTVRDADERLTEDALRILRAVRFAAQLDFALSRETQDSIKRHSRLLEKVSYERIRDEFVKLIMSDNPEYGLHVSHQLEVLQYVTREISNCFGVDQDRNHIYDVGTHLIKSLQFAADQKYPLHVRLSALFHDVGKPATKAFDKKNKVHTFYGHEVVGARITKKTLQRLKFDKKTTDKVVTLVRYHMFFSDSDTVTLSAVRRIITNVGKDLIWDLINLRYCDRIGMGRPKADPYRLRLYESMIDEALRDPISVKMLKMNGDIMIAELGFTPGPRIGWILHALLEQVLDDPTRNTREYLENKVLDLNKLSDVELKKIGKSGKEKRDKTETKEIKKLRRKHNVK